MVILCSVYDIRVGEPTLPFQQDYNKKKTEFLFLQAIKVLESRKKIEKKRKRPLTAYIYS